MGCNALTRQLNHAKAIMNQLQQQSDEHTIAVMGECLTTAVYPLQPSSLPSATAIGTTHVPGAVSMSIVRTPPALQVSVALSAGGMKGVMHCSGVPKFTNTRTSAPVEGTAQFNWQVAAPGQMNGPTGRIIPIWSCKYGTSTPDFILASCTTYSLNSFLVCILTRRDLLAHLCHAIS